MATDDIRQHCGYKWGTPHTPCVRSRGGSYMHVCGNSITFKKKDWDTAIARGNMAETAFKKCGTHKCSCRASHRGHNKSGVERT